MLDLRNRDDWIGSEQLGEGLLVRRIQEEVTLLHQSALRFVDESAHGGARHKEIGQRGARVRRSEVAAQRLINARMADFDCHLRAIGQPAAVDLTDDGDRNRG